MHRKIAVGLAALVLCLGMAATPASAAKKCKKLCKPELTACLTPCASLKGKEKRLCKKACKTTARTVTIPLCKERVEHADTCSPSGAFID